MSFSNPGKYVLKYLNCDILDMVSACDLGFLISANASALWVGIVEVSDFVSYSIPRNVNFSTKI